MKKTRRFRTVQGEREHTAQRRAQGRAFLEWIKAAIPCADCGRCFPPECVDFDHVRGTKRRGLARICHYTADSIQREITKCDLVCACCHRTRTKVRGYKNHFAKAA